MQSKILKCHVVHARKEPIEHAFSYPYYLYAFDLDELGTLADKHRWFGYNKKKLVSIHDTDYLSESSHEISIKEKLASELKRLGYHQDYSRVVLVTGARYLNYVFNPVSFYFCYREGSELIYLVAEINNTFDERHLYIVPVYAINKDSKGFYHYQEVKSFHVSPFNDLSGEYAFSFLDIDQALDIRINIVKGGKTSFNSRLSGDSLSFNNYNFIATIARFPFAALLAMPRILWQAGKLHYIHKMPVYKKPNPSSQQTIKVARPKWRESIAIGLIERVLSKVKKGEIILSYPNGVKKQYKGHENGCIAEINLESYKFFTKIAYSGLVGVGEAFTLSYWNSPNLTNVINLFLDNRDTFRSQLLHTLLSPISLFNRVINRIRHLYNPNNIKGSKRNIHAHYDLGNEFFAQFLDSTLSYSCGLYASQKDSLETAQKRKIESVIHKARVEEGNKVLEIGSGWGSLALELAEKSNINVTSITLSEEQLELATRRAQERNLTERVTFKLQDYRSIIGQYDRIISVEMLEAVGHHYLGEYFKSCERLLAPEGIIVLQVITFPDNLYQKYRRSCDWIQKYIFPGCCLPSIASLAEAISKNSSLVVESCENIGPHYAPTLAAWRENLLKNKEKILAQRFPSSFIKTWEYYFSYCEAAFSSRFLGVHQIVLTRPQNGYLIKTDIASRQERVAQLFRLSA